MQAFDKRQDLENKFYGKGFTDPPGVLRHGALERGEAQFALKTSERTARNTLKQLTAAGFLTSASPKTPVRLAFPLEYRERLFPNLFADADLPE